MAQFRIVSVENITIAPEVPCAKLPERNWREHC